MHFSSAEEEKANFWDPSLLHFTFVPPPNFIHSFAFMMVLGKDTKNKVVSQIEESF